MYDDTRPEVDEVFDIVLVSAVSADGKNGTTPTSGASINPSAQVIIKIVSIPDVFWSKKYNESVITRSW